MIDLKRLRDKEYRMNHLYRIIGKDSLSILFKMNQSQREVFHGLTNRNLILKARQLGMSTFCILYLLDEVIFNPNTSAGIVSYSLPHAQHIFKNIVGHAINNFPPELMPLGITAKSTKEINFNNGSNFRVDTSLRGGTAQLVLITEYGKVCARSPSRADEIIAGTLESVPKNGTVLIESTGEGTTGPFTEMCLASAARGNENLESFDYKLHFFPWFLEPEYTLDSQILEDVRTVDYFKSLDKKLNIEFTRGQRAWYQKKWEILGDKMQQEYPSTVEESFVSNSDAFYYARALQDARTDDRIILHDIYDPLLPVYAALDIAVTDLTVITFFQLHHGERRIIDYYADTNKGVDFYTNLMLRDKPYIYDTIALPHDSVKKDGIIVENSYKSEFTRLFAHTGTRIVVLPRTSKNVGIGNAINKTRHTVFFERKTKDYITALSKYRKKWSEQLGRYIDEPYHDVNCFVGDTKIQAPGGEKEIRDIKVGDFVVTPNGSRRVLKTYKYSTRDLVTIGDGSNTITCTPHHKVFTTRGLILADSLRYDDQIITKEDKELCQAITYRGKEIGLGFRDCFSLMSPEIPSILMDIDTRKTSLGTGWAEAIGLQELLVCTEPFGSITMVKSLKRCTSIIGMKINQIMKYPILSSLTLPTTRSIISRVKRGQCSQGFILKQLKKLKSGMDQILEELGMLNMVEMYSKQSLSSTRYALVAESNTLLNGQHLKDVQTLADQNLGEIQALTMNLESVRYVKSHSRATSTQRKGLVQSVVNMSLDAEVDVYDFEVELDNCYYANNLLVSNSDYADSYRYAQQLADQIEKRGNASGALERHRETVASRSQRM